MRTVILAPFLRPGLHNDIVIIVRGIIVLGRRENRLQPRRNTMIMATAIFDNGRTRLDCVIRNLSDGGAKLEFATVRGIPQTFDLLVPGHRPQHCQVAWRALKEMGVQFMHAT
jgi:hypothetical protein